MMAGIYVHIPFCVSKCRYCDFVSYAGMEHMAREYAECVIREAETRAGRLRGRSFDTLYIGGGTPSSIDERLLVSIVRAVKDDFGLPADAEITVEMNPGTVSAEKIAAYKECGINRFSVGMQAARDDILREIGRMHTVDDFVACASLLAGENFSADVMIGLKGQTESDVAESIELAAGCGAQHISMYALTPEPGTPVFRDFEEGLLPSDDEVADQYESGYAKLRSLGFERYEVSNFCRSGKRSRHNENYWRRGEYIGLGVSASSHITCGEDLRFTNVSGLDEYVLLSREGKSVVKDVERLSETDEKKEYIMLAFRTSDGLDPADYEAAFGSDFFSEYGSALDACRECLETVDGKVRIRDEFFFVQNGVIVNFF